MEVDAVCSLLGSNPESIYQGVPSLSLLGLVGASPKVNIKPRRGRYIYLTQTLDPFHLDDDVFAEVT